MFKFYFFEIIFAKDLKEDIYMKKFVLGILFFSLLFFNKFSINAQELYHGSFNVSDLQTITSVRASHILVNTKEEALKIRQEILNGISFEDAAKKYSLCPSKTNGGDLGYFGKGDMVPEFENAAFALPINEVSFPIKTQFGWHLIKVTDKK
jgi:peptidyl-prolyl cis-trans isomerase C